MKKQKEEKDTSPDLNVKADGEFVGSAWINEGEYGKYITVTLNKAFEEGDRLFISPRKGKGKLELAAD